MKEESNQRKLIRDFFTKDNDMIAQAIREELQTCLSDLHAVNTIDLSGDAGNIALAVKARREAYDTLRDALELLGISVEPWDLQRKGKDSYR